MSIYKTNLEYLEKVETFNSGYYEMKLRLTYRKPRKFLWDKVWRKTIKYNGPLCLVDVNTDYKYFTYFLKND